MAGLDDSGGPEGSVETSLDETGTPVVRLSGEIDMANADSIAAAIEPIMAKGPERLIVDASGLDFMDSSGIALLLRWARDSVRVELRHPSRIIRRTVESMGLTDVLHIEP
ncbi:MAG TPA: STAS domain-containing protein [Acidimicrobiales bacterium]|jgi:anti-anti-sigma factor|nr:STAS domain-containing protein [Acidimicrobiales bacterium]